MLRARLRARLPVPLEKLQGVLQSAEQRLGVCSVALACLQLRYDLSLPSDTGFSDEKVVVGFAAHSAVAPLASLSTRSRSAAPLRTPRRANSIIRVCRPSDG